MDVAGELKHNIQPVWKNKTNDMKPILHISSNRIAELIKGSALPMYLIGVLICFFSYSSEAQVSYTGATYNQDFQSLTATNLTPATVAGTTMVQVSGLSGGGTYQAGMFISS